MPIYEYFSQIDFDIQRVDFGALVDLPAALLGCHEPRFREDGQMG